LEHIAKNAKAFNNRASIEIRCFAFCYLIDAKIGASRLRDEKGKAKYDGYIGDGGERTNLGTQ